MIQPLASPFRTAFVSLLSACFSLLMADALLAEAVHQQGPATQGQLAAPSPTDVVPIVLLRRSDKVAPAGADGDVLTTAGRPGDTLAERAAVAMADPHGFGQFALRLDRFAKTYLMGDREVPPERRAALDRPAYLFLSDRQGGFPAQGFWFEQPDGSLREMKEAPFVDMLVGERDFEPGNIAGLEAIYAHELGHLIMAALAGPGPRKASSAVHFITVRTDAWSAFIEGWGEHFQAMALDHAAGGQTAPWVTRRDDGPSETERFWRDRFAREEVDGCWVCPANLRFLWWHGRGEQRLRDAPMRQNLFIHRIVLPQAMLDGGRPPAALRMYRDVVPPSSAGPLKNGAEALESEGVIATLFYRIASDPKLRGTYRDAAFYEPFLSKPRREELARLGPQALVTPAENVYLKAFHVLHRHFHWGDWPAIEFVRGYAAAFPDEAEAMYDVFLDVTRGVTVEAGAARQADRRYLTELRQHLLAGDARLDAALGPPLWMAAPGITVGMGVFRHFPAPSSITFDINAADVADLQSVPGVSPSLAEAIVRTRDTRGAFGPVNDLASVPGITADLLERFEAMHQKMRARLAAPVVRRSDPAWLKDLLVPALKGSYLAAAAWQFGRAAFLAGVAFLLLNGISLRASSGTLEPFDLGRRPSRLRRAAGVAARAVAIGAVPCAMSAALYARGASPTPINMAALGLAWGVALVLVGRLHDAWPPLGATLRRIAASAGTAAFVGWMY